MIENYDAKDSELLVNDEGQPTNQINRIALNIWITYFIYLTFI